MRGYRVSPYTGDIRVMIGSNRVMNVFSSRLLAPRSHQALLPINAAKAAGEPVALPQLSFTPITRANLKAIKAQISKTLSFEDLSSELENIIHSGSCGSILLAVAVQVRYRPRGGPVHPYYWKMFRSGISNYLFYFHRWLDYSIIELRNCLVILFLFIVLTGTLDCGS